MVSKVPKIAKSKFYISSSIMGGLPLKLVGILVSIRSLIIFIILSSIISTASAQVIKAVNCSNQKIQDAIDSSEAGKVSQLNVTGSCTENITIPIGKEIVINGLNGASLSPKDVSKYQVSTAGIVRINNMKIEGRQTSDAFIVVAGGGTLYLNNSDILVTANATNIIGILQHSIAKISNSRIRGYVNTNTTYAAAISVDSGSSVIIRSDPDNGLNSITKSYSTSIQMFGGATGSDVDSIGCGVGSTVTIRTSNGSVDGTLKYGNVSLIGSSDKANGTGIRLNQCDLRINNESRESTVISGHGKSGILMFNSTGQIQGVTIQNNGKSGVGLSLHMSSLVLSNVLINNNGADKNNDIDIRKMSIVNFTKWGTSNRSIVGKIFCNNRSGVVVDEQAITNELSSNCVLP